ncbi:MAG: zinc ribbon domain-containing protein [Lachnospiraceae bacterium]|nr:zinc ribbon domain-containing protein [Lachnospiraceae bacterium]
MFCRNCGANLNDNAAFCPSCRAATGQQQVVNAGTPYAFQPSIGMANTTQQQYQQQQTELPMNWFKFIIYFQLFASCVVASISAITLITGAIWDGQGIPSNLLYAMYPSLRIVCIIAGIVEIGVAVFSILCRQKLAGFQKGGPQFYWGLLATNIILSVFLTIALSSILGVAVIDSTISTQLVVGAVMLGVNVVYFRKRMHLFVN